MRLICLIEVFAASVRGVGDAGDDEGLDLVPPGVDGLPQPPGLVHVRAEHGHPEHPAGVVGCVEVGARQQEPQAFLHGPGCADLVGGIIDAQHMLEAMLGPDAEPVAGAWSSIRCAQARSSLRPR